ncbi:hypothetical protein EON73_05740, partial [bacterium]
MNKQFDDLIDLLSLKLEKLKLKTSESIKMAEIAQIEAQLALLTAANQALSQKVTELTNNQTAFQNANAVKVTEYEDITP